MPTSLECRLLCASVSAYGIQSAGTIVKQQPYYDAAQFVQPPVVFAAGVAKINACLVGTNSDGVVVAFRGTLPPASPDHEQTARDWINDLDAELIQAGNMPGRVHAGFWDAVDTLWAGLLPEVQRQLDAAGPDCNLYLTGHSKGGAMANLAAMRVHAERGVKAEVYTYAAPHPGNEDFADACDAQIESTRYEYADDIVPHLPPSLAFRHMFADVPFAQPYVHRLDLNYMRVGTLRYIGRDGTIVPDSPTLRFSRFASLAALIVAGGFAQIVGDHDSRCAGGYMMAVCPAGVCP